MLPALSVADVFAGGGSMGLEALSRGAASCCFFERDRAALEALRKNLRTLRVGAEASIVMQDAWREAVATPDGGPFDLVLLDPPYVDSEDASDDGAVRRYLKRFDQLDSSRSLVVLHHPARVRYAAGADELWQVLKQRTFGNNGVTVFQL
jgi:16S rRNA (guanine966-N2)-methyltransferase